MPVHHGGKVGAAARRLAKPGTSKGQKAAAGKTLAKHKAAAHGKR